MSGSWKDRQLYHLYIYMLRRCSSSTTPQYHRYGGRGIKVCERWKIQSPRGQGFRNFKSDLGPRPKGYSLERVNNDGNYTPENCKWVPREQQYRNRCSNVWIEFMGVRMIAKDWARETGVREDVITKRLRRGVPPEIAIFETGNLHLRDPSAMIEAAAEKKRKQTHCKRGHPFEKDHICRICKREAMRHRRSLLLD
jgi:hypothetical protein